MTTRAHASRWVILLWTLITLAGVLTGLYVIPWMMPRAASHTQHVNILTMQIFTIAAAPVMGLVYAVMAYAVRFWRFRGQGVPPDGPPLRTHPRMTAIWLVVSATLTVFLLVWGLALLASDFTSHASGEDITVDVVGQQWVWNFDYTPIAHRGVKTPELYLPINKEVVFDVTSKDVVHGFWIPSMGIKINANPGATTTVSVTPNRLGTYRIRCTEICGLNHAYMVTRVHVLTQKAFDHWLATQPTRI